VNGIDTTGIDKEEIMPMFQTCPLQLVFRHQSVDREKLAHKDGESEVEDDEEDSRNKRDSAIPGVLLPCPHHSAQPCDRDQESPVPVG
ncbi:MAG: hypothetical protein ACKPKO_63880, partial [Candidatus Fonsibacter sp.]